MRCTWNPIISWDSSRPGAVRLFPSGNPGIHPVRELHAPSLIPAEFSDQPRKSLVELGLLVPAISIVLTPRNAQRCTAGKYDNQLAGEPTDMPAPATPLF